MADGSTRVPGTFLFPGPFEQFEPDFEYIQYTQISFVGDFIYYILTGTLQQLVLTSTLHPSINLSLSPHPQPHPNL